MRLTENQKAQLFRDYQAADELYQEARDRLDDITDQLGDASDAYEQCKGELEWAYEACKEGGVFDDQ